MICERCNQPCDVLVHNSEDSLIVRECMQTIQELEQRNQTFRDFITNEVSAILNNILGFSLKGNHNVKLAG